MRHLFIALLLSAPLAALVAPQAAIAAPMTNDDVIKMVKGGLGAVAGHMIEKKAKDGKTWEIGVHFVDGNSRIFHQDTHPSWNTGARVKLVNGALAPL